MSEKKKTGKKVEAAPHVQVSPEKLEAAKAGTANRAWVEKALEEKGYEIIDDVYRP